MTDKEKSEMIDRYYQNAKNRYGIGGLAQAQRDNNAFSNIGNAANNPNDYVYNTHTSKFKVGDIFDENFKLIPTEDAEFEIIEPKQIENK